MAKPHSTTNLKSEDGKQLVVLCSHLQPLEPKHARLPRGEGNAGCVIRLLVSHLLSLNAKDACCLKKQRGEQVQLMERTSIMLAGVFTPAGRDGAAWPPKIANGSPNSRPSRTHTGGDETGERPSTDGHPV